MKKKSCKQTILILFIILTSSYAQESAKHSFGLTASFSGAQLDILFPIRIGQQFTLSPGVGLASFGNNYTELHLSIAPKIYLTQGVVKPFLGGRAVYLNSTPEKGEAVTDYLVGLLAGGEYFIDEQFSFGIETQLNFSISDIKSLRFGNPDEVNINTATIIFLSIYF